MAQLAEMNEEYRPLVWRGALTDGPLDKALPRSAYWHEHAFSESTQMRYLISVSPVAVEITAHNGARWEPGLARLYLLDSEHFTSVVTQAQQHAELCDHMMWRSRRTPLEDWRIYHD